jgi:hypothetical protein
MPTPADTGRASRDWYGKVSPMPPAGRLWGQLLDHQDVSVRCGHPGDGVGLGEAVEQISFGHKANG